MSDTNKSVRTIRAGIVESLARVQQKLRYLKAEPAAARGCPFLQGLADMEERTGWHGCSVGDRLGSYMRRMRGSASPRHVLMTGPKDALTLAVLSRVFPALGPSGAGPKALRSLRSSWPDDGVLSRQPAVMLSAHYLGHNQAPSGDGLCRPRALTHGELCMMGVHVDRAPRDFQRITSKQLAQNLEVILGAASSGGQVDRLERLFGCASQDYERDLAEVEFAVHEEGLESVATDEVSRRFGQTVVSFIPGLFDGAWSKGDWSETTPGDGEVWRNRRAKALFANGYHQFDLILVVLPAGSADSKHVSALHDLLVASGIAKGDVIGDWEDLVEKSALLLVPEVVTGGQLRLTGAPDELGRQLAGVGVFVDPALAPSIRIVAPAPIDAYPGTDRDLDAVRASSPDDWRSVRRLCERLSDWMDRAADQALAARTAIGRTGVRDLEYLQSAAREALGERSAISKRDALAAALRYAEWQAGVLSNADIRARVKVLAVEPLRWHANGGASNGGLAGARKDAVAELAAAVHEALGDLMSLSSGDGPRGVE
jgi:hypothetical protein